MRDIISVPTIRHGAFSIDTPTHEVRVGDQVIPLTATEFRLLYFLASRPGVVFTRDQIIRGVLGSDANVTPRTVDSHMRSVRSALGSARDLLETVRGVGYRFVSETSEEGAPAQVHHAFVGPFLPGGIFLLEREKTYSIGRRPSNDLVLNHAEVSRCHARLRWEEGAFVIVDAGSSNGVDVDHSDLGSSRVLKDGSVVAIGPFPLRFREFEDVQRVLDELDREQLELSTQAISLPKQGTGRKEFEGSALIRLCQLISLRHQDGVLQIEGQAASGQIEFLAGILLRAECETSAEGEAARDLLCQGQGHYRFEEGSSEAAAAELENVYDALSRTTELLQALLLEVR